MLRPERLTRAALAAALSLSIPSCGGGSAPEAADQSAAAARPEERRAPPRSESYGGRPDPAEPTATETSLWDEVVAAGSIRCSRDPRLALAARWHARDLAASGRPPRSGDIDHLRFRLLAFGGTDYALQPLVTATDAEGRRSLARLARERGERWTHCGLGVGGEGPDEVAVWIGVERSLEIDPVPVAAPVGSVVSIRCRLAGDGTARILAFLGMPDGSVARLDPAAPSSPAFTARFSLDREGRHDLEILLDSGSGPEIAALLPIYAGIQPDPRPVVIPDPASPEGAVDAAATLSDLVDAVRRKAGLDPLERDPNLDRLAEEHSSDMVRAGFFGHVSPTRGPLASRLRARGLAPSKSAENVARSSSAARAHRNLIASPSHRLNIVDPEFTHLGIGVAREGDDLLVTEIFARW